MDLLHRLLGLLIAGVVFFWRASCRYDVAADDPRPALRAAGRPYVYALLHAQQIAAVFCSDETHLGAMVSRSADGELLVPTLRLRGITAVRGSSRRSQTDKGGLLALATLAAMARQGRPALLAVDGPRGPRNRVHLGAIRLAQQVGGVIVPVAVVPTRRWILRRTWDRMQLPKPFSHMRLHFAPAIEAPANAERERLRQAVQDALLALELRLDPTEAEPKEDRYAPRRRNARTARRKDTKPAGPDF